MRREDIGSIRFGGTEILKDRPTHCFPVCEQGMKSLSESPPGNPQILHHLGNYTLHTFCKHFDGTWRAEKEDKEEEMIKSRMEAIFIISMHTMQNIIGVIRFSYGFHRTGSPNVGFKLDVCLGTESFANILTDAIVIFLLWKEEKSLGVDVRLAQMTRVLGVFIAWNAIALHVCAFGNLMGLLYPPKWLYYTSLLYEYYLFYKATKGKPFDSAALSRTAVSVSHASAFSEDRKTFSPIKIEPVRRQSIVVQYREAVKEQAARAGGSQRRPSASMNAPTPQWPLKCHRGIAAARAGNQLLVQARL
ncbi:hypothetical protein HPB51_000241 [Rhipicephalus microplus]|uniref:Uncharacterized protein n=1 Tax=Rhipicephalus microplus TaxID=6941 RepID=A0A9J6EVM1_RHIMP|nr:hypothetical protein HPB51_000241 [Rhipicephalus microplus]